MKRSVNHRKKNQPYRSNSQRKRNTIKTHGNASRGILYVLRKLAKWVRSVNPRRLLTPSFLQALVFGRRFPVRTLSIALIACLSIGSLCYIGIKSHVVSAYFKIDGLRITGNVRLSSQDIKQSLAWVADMSTLPCPKKAVQTALLKEPWVESASVYCELPNLISIHITEHEAVGSILFEGQSEKVTLLNAQGVPVKVASPKEQSEWPIITGIAREYFDNDRDGVSEEIKRILESIQKYVSRSTRPLLGQVDIQGTDIVFFTEAPHLAIHIGSELDDHKLIYFDQVIQTFGDNLSKIERVFLDQSVYKDRVVVRFVNKDDKTLLSL